VRTVEELLHRYQHVIEELTVVTGSKGVFDVELDGELLFSKKAVGRHAQPGEVLERFRAALGPGAQEYER
jgi:selT/selW/selH-like putative selenoprotein